MQATNEASVAAFNAHRGPKLVDLGCGSGCEFSDAYLRRHPGHAALGFDTLTGAPADPAATFQKCNPDLVPSPQLVVRDAARTGVRSGSVDLVVHLMPLPNTMAQLFPAVAGEAARMLVPGGTFQVVIQGPHWDRDRGAAKWKVEQRAPLLAALAEAGFQVEQFGDLLEPGTPGFVDTAFARLCSEDFAPGIYSFTARLPSPSRADAFEVPGTSGVAPTPRDDVKPPAWVGRGLR